MTRDDATGLEVLAERLDVAPERLHFLSALDETALTRLDGLVSQAAERDDRELDEALERTVRFVPRPLRGKVRRTLVPEEDA